MTTFKELMLQEPFNYATASPFLATIEDFKDVEISRVKEFMRSLTLAYAKEEGYSPDMNLRAFLAENYLKSAVMTLASMYSDIGVVYSHDAHEYVANRRGVLGLHEFKSKRVAIPTLKEFATLLAMRNSHSFEAPPGKRMRLTY